MNVAQRVSGSDECAPPTSAAADGAGGIEASITLGEFVEAVGSVTEEVTELVTVVAHIVHTRKALWVRPTRAGVGPEAWLEHCSHQRESTAVFN